jgi:triosephosphate isomerase
MNTNGRGAAELAKTLASSIGSLDGVDLAVCPPFVYLSAVRQALAGTRIALGAQDVFYEDDGAYTGEVSTAMLRDAGCRYVIIGHSERRHVLGETDEMINRKIIKALSDGLEVIFCVGELLEERKSGLTLEVVDRQVRIGLEGVAPADAARLTVAYEPVWAIGTGVNATPQQAQEVHSMIRELLARTFNPALASSIRIQYGGSVKPANAAELMRQRDIDGALVGGASLKAPDFEAIVRAAL